MNLSKLFFATIFLLSFYQSNAQRNYNGYNLLGIQGGITFFEIQTEDLVTEQRQGFSAGFSTRGAFRNNFDLIYGLSFHNSTIGVEGKSLLGSPENIGYSIQGVQLNLLCSYNLIMNHLSFEIGPVVGLNGNMKLDNNKFENYILSGYNTVRAKDIQDISKFNVALAGGITSGFEHFRLSAQYQYGLANMLAPLNGKGLENSNFKGNSSTILLMGILYF